MNKTLLPALLAVASVLLIGTASSAMADSGDSDESKKRWILSIGDSQGTLEITENTDKRALKSQAIPLDQAASGYEDIYKAKLGKAVNDDGKQYLVWKLISYNYDEESDTKSKTIYVLDAGNGVELTEPITKEGGSCGKDKHKTSSDNA
ncbi:hypothetical protein [Nitrosopumilus sp.]|uniref:hypothetical protein n=1 Tax=Nitrosopumilus sp. TaxID=2024843 RepID=UPI003D0E1158